MSTALYGFCYIIPKHYIGNVRQGSDYGKQTLHPLGKHPDDVITDIQPIAPSSKDRLGYPTQKPIALICRIILAGSNPGGMILDPFCGCATACIAAEKLDRQWSGIDISPKAAELVKHRMQNEIGFFYDGAHREDVPIRSDLSNIRRYSHPENKKALYGSQGGYCSGCNEHFTTRHLEIDHKIPKSKGGSDHIDNLQLLCGSCNRIKGDRTQEYLINKLKDESLIQLVG